MAYTLQKTASAKSDPTAKNRVWDFFAESNRTRPASRRQPQQLRRKNRPCTYKTASGIPLWPSRDPIGEKGGESLYGFLHNNPVSLIDSLGLYVHEAGVIGPYQAVMETLGAERGWQAINMSVQMELITTPMPTELKSIGNKVVRWITRVNSYYDIRKHYDTAITNGSLTSGPGNRWVFTCKYGWIDLGHFFTTAWLAYGSGSKYFSYGASLGMEAVQYVIKLINTGTGGSLYPKNPELWQGNGESAYTAEDLNSNYQGAKFGKQQFNHDFRSASSSSGGDWISSSFSTFLRSSGAVETRKDPYVMDVLRYDASLWHAGNYYALNIKFTKDSQYKLQQSLPAYRCLCDGNLPKKDEWKY